MATTSLTTAIKSLDYNAQGKAKNVNAMGYKVTGKGIVEGGLLTKVDADTVRISAFVAVLYDESIDEGISVREQLGTTADVDVSPADCVIVLREDWTDTIPSYPQLISTTLAGVQADDVIVGRAIFISGTLQTTFDYTIRDNYLPQRDINRLAELRMTPVLSGTTYQNYVAISAGIYTVGNNDYYFAGGNSGTFPTAIGWYSVFIKSTDSSVVISTNDFTPLKDHFYIGYIYKASAVAYVTGDMIYQRNLVEKYPQQFSGSIDILNATTFLTTNSASTAGLATGALAINGGTSTGKLLSIKGASDSAEHFYVNGDGKLYINPPTGSEASVILTTPSATGKAYTSYISGSSGASIGYDGSLSSLYANAQMSIISGINQGSGIYVKDKIISSTAPTSGINKDFAHGLTSFSYIIQIQAFVWNSSANRWSEVNGVATNDDFARITWTTSVIGINFSAIDFGWGNSLIIYIKYY